MKKQKKGSNSLLMIQRYFPNVERVEDGKRSVIIEVTKADNEHGDVRNHRTCALAIACKRFFHSTGVMIGLTTSWIIQGKVAVRFRNSATLSREIMSFDRRAGFDPGLYWLTPASPSNQLGLERAYDKVRDAKNGKGHKPRFMHFTRNVRTTLGRYGMEAEIA